MEKLTEKLNEPGFTLTPISQKPKRTGGIPWNFGLTKETSETVKLAGQKISKIAKGNPRYKWSDARKQNFISKITGHKGSIVSEEQKKKLSELAANQRKWFSISSSELKIKKRLIEAGFIEGTDFVHNQGLKLLTGKWKRPDFRFPKTKTILEFDGERWHKEGNEKDAERNKEYERLGYRVIILSEKTMGKLSNIIEELN